MPVFSRKNNHELRWGLSLLVILLVLAVFAPLICRHDPQTTSSQNWLQPPGMTHYFGTDRLGRDIFSRVLFGARISLTVGMLSMLLSVSIGMLIGSAAGYYGGVTDAVLMRLTDIVLVFPTMLLVLTLLAVFEPALWLVIAVIGGTGWPSVARLVRSEVMQLQKKEFVATARMLGANNRRIFRRHLFPNAIGPVLVAATLCVPAAIMTEAGLGYFGLGVMPPTPTWGNMLRDAQLYLRYAWWYALFPGFFIFLTVFAFHLTGEGLRKYFALSRNARRGLRA